MASLIEEVGFVHLHVHSSYSLLEGALKVPALVKAAVADGQPALALTDTNNLFGALEFSEKAAGEGLQPIPGIQLAVQFEAPDPLARGGQIGPANIVLLACDEAGYGNLLRLASRAHLDGALGEPPRLAASALAESAGGLIALTGGPTGALDAGLGIGRRDLALARLETLKAAFGAERLYIEIQRHAQDGERAIERELLGLATAHGLPIVATNEPFFGKAEDESTWEPIEADLDRKTPGEVAAHALGRPMPGPRLAAE